MYLRYHTLKKTLNGFYGSNCFTFFDLHGGGVHLHYLLLHYYTTTLLTLLKLLHYLHYLLLHYYTTYTTYTTLHLATIRESTNT